MPKPTVEDFVAQALAERNQTATISRCASCQGLLVTETPSQKHSGCDPAAIEVVITLECGQITFRKNRGAPLEALAALLVAERALDLAVVFGSRARGDELPLSDVDLMIEWNLEAERFPRACGPPGSSGAG